MPKLTQMYRRLESQGLALIGVHTAHGAEKMPAYVTENEIPFPVAIDTRGKTVAAFAVDSFPDYYLIDRAGKLRVADLANADLERAVTKLLAEKAPAATANASANGAGKQPQPIDFAKIERKIAKLPELESPLYGLFLFGLHGEARVWAVLDKQSKQSTTYDVLHLDLDADGDLTEEGERFTSNNGKFEIGKLVDPGTGAVHENVSIQWTKTSIRYSMLWRGEQLTIGCYGPARDTYVNFAPTLADAPIFVPGWDRPLEFEHWMSGELRRGRSNEFKVFVGARGNSRGAFSGTKDTFLPVSDSPIATLLYTTTDGKKRRYQAKLMERC